MSRCQRRQLHKREKAHIHTDIHIYIYVYVYTCVTSLSLEQQHTLTGLRRHIYIYNMCFVLHLRKDALQSFCVRERTYMYTYIYAHAHVDTHAQKACSVCMFVRGPSPPNNSTYIYICTFTLYHRKMIQLQVHLQLPCYDFCFLY